MSRASMLRPACLSLAIAASAGCGESEPRAEPDPAPGRLVVHKSLSGGPLFIEGSVTRLKVVAEDGTVVVDGLRGAKTLDEPLFDGALAPGGYELSSVERPCSASCPTPAESGDRVSNGGMLDPPHDGTRCTVAFEVREGRTTAIEIVLFGLAGGVAAECAEPAPG